MDTPIEIVAAVVGCPSTGEFRLIDMSQEKIPLPDDEALKMREKGWFFVGTLGFYNGTFAAKCEDTKDPKDGALLVLATVEFARHVARRLTPQGDGADWLKQLWDLPDEREN